MRLALVGATGLVGQKMIQVMQERGIRPSKFLPVASNKSKGKEVIFNGQAHSVVGIEDALNTDIDVALFSAGGSTSLEWAPKFAEKGVFVIDNSSAWRMDESVPLVVPEINSETINESTKIIANPNCSTIQMVMALAPLHKTFVISRIVVSTYQSISGTGKAAVDQMMNERANKEGAKVYPHQIDMNCLPHCDSFLENGYTKEEMKLSNETKKILRDDEIAVTATAVRVPVMGGHSESVNVAFNHDFTLPRVRQLLASTAGVTLMDAPERNEYPMPLFQTDSDEVYVGRVRRDESQAATLNLWIVSDNLRKGAATNAVQILQYLMNQKFV